MIRIECVHKRFGARTVLDGVDARVASGRITVLVGPNGAGKTTLLKILLGLARSDAGRLMVAEREVGADPAYRAGIGYMPQIVRFPGHRRGLDLLEALRALRGDGRAPDLSLAEAFGVTDLMTRPLGTLSGGTRQRINAVLAFAFRPTLLVLDEPTAGLDPLAAVMLKRRLAAERARGTTVFVTTHVLAELEGLADDVLHLAEGRAAWAGPVEALKASTGEATLEGAVARLLADAASRSAA